MSVDQDLADRLRHTLGHRDDVREQRMFGGLAFLVRGHLAVAASGEGGLMVRCEPAASEALLAETGVEPLEMRGRALKGWLRVDAAGLDDDADLGRWVDIGVEFVLTLPPK